MSEVNWREEAPSWSCESEGSGEILDEGMASDLLSGIIGENSYYFGKWRFQKVLNKRVPLIVANVY